MAFENKNIPGLIMTLFIFVLLLGSVVALTYGFNADASRTESKKYGDYELKISGNYLSAEFEGLEVFFSHYPEEISYTNVGPVVERLRKGGEVYSVSDPDSLLKSEIARTHYEINHVSASKYGTYLDVGFTKENSFSLPPVACEDATSSKPVILFSESNSTSEVTEENDCVTVNYQTNLDFYRLRDRIIYELMEFPDE